MYVYDALAVLYLDLIDLVGLAWGSYDPDEMSVSVTQEVVEDSDFDFSHLYEELSVGERASERGLVDSQTVGGVHLSVLVGVWTEVEHKTVFLTGPDEHGNVDSVPGRINAITVNSIKCFEIKVR